MEHLNKFIDLTNEEMDLIEIHMEMDSTVRFISLIEGWRKNGFLYIKYSDEMLYQYNVEKKEWKRIEGDIEKWELFI